MSAAFFQQVDATVDSLIEQAQASLGITISHGSLPPAVHGGLLKYHFDAERGSQKAREVLEELNRIASTSEGVIVSFIENGCLYIQIGFDAFTALRIDTGKKSLLWNMLDAPPIESDKRPQWISIKSAFVPTPLGSVSLVPRHLQLLVYHFQTSLRLNPTDLTQAVHLIKPLASSWSFNDPNTLQLPDDFDHTMSSPLAKSLYATLRHMVGHGYISKLEEAFSSMPLLQALEDTHELSAVDRAFFGTYVVAFHNSARNFRTKARLLSPSFFIPSAEQDLQCNPQVHIVEYAMHYMRGVMLVSFDRMPDDNDIGAVRNSLADLFHLTADGWTITLPWHYNTQHIGKLFRPDGMVNWQITKQAISGLLKSARSIQRPQIFTDEVLGPKISTSEQRRARTIVIWLRQSSHWQNSDIASQLWFTLSQFPECLTPIQTNDTVTIAVEFCSTLKHSWNDRFMTSNVIKHIQQSGKEGYIVTGWADRLSRRKQDLPLIFADLRRVSATWLFRGVSEDDVEPNWLNGEEQLDHLESALSANVGTDRPAVFYKYQLITMSTRIIDAGPTNDTIRALNDAMATTLRAWQIDTVIIYCRVSPKRGGNFAGDATFSLERQITMLKLFCPASMKIIVVREAGVSAYTDMERSLVPALTSQTGRCCVFAVSLDRVLRRIDAIPYLRPIFASRGHIGVCFLWDCYTKVPLCEGLKMPAGTFQSLENALEDSRRAQPSRGCLPVVQPIVWTVDSTSQTECCYEEYIHRHAEKAELQCLPYTTRSKKEERHGTPERLAQVDAELLRTESRDWSKQRQDRWSDFINDYFNLGPDQLTFLQNGSKEWLCHCNLNQLCDMATCICQCKFCRISQNCACQESECECPEICNCACAHCHNEEPVSSSTNLGQALPDNGGLRELSSTNLGQALPDNGGLRELSSAINFGQGISDSGGLRELSSSAINLGEAPSPSSNVSIGRTVDQDIHSAFVEFRAKEDDKCLSVQCIYCQQIRAKNTSRQKQHLLECPGLANHPNDSGGLRELSSSAINQAARKPRGGKKATGKPSGVKKVVAKPSEVNKAAGEYASWIDTRTCTFEGCTKPTTQRSWKRYLCLTHHNALKEVEVTQENCRNRHCLKKRAFLIPYCSLRCYAADVTVPQLCEVQDCDVPCPPELKSNTCMRHHQHDKKNAYLRPPIVKAREKLESEYWGHFDD